MGVQLEKDFNNLDKCLLDDFDVNLLLVSDNNVQYSAPLVEQWKDNLLFEYFELFPLHNYLVSKAALVTKREHTV